MNILMRVDRVIRKISEVLSFIGAVWIFTIMGIIVYDVLARTFFGGSFAGTVEIVRNSIVGIAFFMIPWAMVQEKHVRTTILPERASPRAARILDFAAYLVGLAVFIGICVSSWEPLTAAYINQEFELSGNFKFITWPIRAIILLGSVLTCWHCLMLLLKQIIPERMCKLT